MPLLPAFPACALAPAGSLSYGAPTPFCPLDADMPPEACPAPEAAWPTVLVAVPPYLPVPPSTAPPAPPPPPPPPAISSTLLSDAVVEDRLATDTIVDEPPLPPEWSLEPC